MSVIYIVNDFGQLVKRGDVLQLRKEGSVYNTIFPFKTDQLVIIGNIEITSPAFKFLMRHQIDTVFLGKNGRFNGRIITKSGKNVFLRRKQFQALDNEQFIKSFTASLVAGKLKNQLAFMQRIIRTKGEAHHCKQAQDSFKKTLQQVSEEKSIDTLRGYEGVCARYYFSIFKYAIQPGWAVFKGRSMNPPEDNVNAVLSFIYTLILYRVESAIEVHGLDSHVGYFHSLEYGKQTLCFDLMEEYRTPIADTLTASLFNLGILEEDDFHDVVFSDEDDEHPLTIEEEVFNSAPEEKREKKGVLLTKTGIKKVITQFEKKLDTVVYYPLLEKKIPYRRLIFEQVRHFRRVLTGEATTYQPLSIK